MATPSAVVVHPLEDVMAKPLSEVMASPIYVELLKRDVVVTADPYQFNGYDKITFTLSVKPGFLDMFPVKPKPADVPVNVLAIPETGQVWNNGKLPIMVPANGVPKVITAEIKNVDISKLHGNTDKGQTIVVVADPLDAIAERTEMNNYARGYCYTIG